MFSESIGWICIHVSSSYACELLLGDNAMSHLDLLIFEFMQINKFLCIIRKFVQVVHVKTAYEDTIFVSENLWINIKAYLFP